MTEPKILSEEEVMAAASSVKDDAVKIDELAVLFPEQTEFEVDGEIIKVREFTFGELPRAMQLVKVFGAVFAFHHSKGTLETPQAMMDICAVGAEELVLLLALNLKKPREWFDAIPTDVGLAMMLAFLKTNLSFFSNRVAPVLATGKLTSNTLGL